MEGEEEVDDWEMERLTGEGRGERGRGARGEGRDVLRVSLTSFFISHIIISTPLSYYTPFPF